uniref:Uncharacterized protein n=1 Tax=Trichogramma kaykai TaxID=54128 RepID=A0ABD2WRS5_9HYME
MCHTVRVHVCARLLPLSSSERTHTSKRRTGSALDRRRWRRWRRWRRRRRLSRWLGALAQLAAAVHVLHGGAEGHRLCRRASRRSLPLSDDAHHQCLHTSMNFHLVVVDVDVVSKLYTNTRSCYVRTKASALHNFAKPAIFD